MQRRSECRSWVNLRKPQAEHMLSELPPIADVVERRRHFRDGATSGHMNKASGRFFQPSRMARRAQAITTKLRVVSQFRFDVSDASNLGADSCMLRLWQRGWPAPQGVPEGNADRVQGLGHRVRKRQLTPLPLPHPQTLSPIHP
jgi:hypothetical protein